VRHVGLRSGSTSTPCHRWFRNHALPVGSQIQKANAIIRGFCNHYRTDYSSAVSVGSTTGPCGRSVNGGAPKRENDRQPKPTANFTRVNGQKFTMPTAYTPAGRMITLLTHSRFHRLRFQQVNGMNSPVDPRLTGYWDSRREQALFRRAIADPATAVCTSSSVNLTGAPSPAYRWRRRPKSSSPNCPRTSRWQRRLEQSLYRSQVGKDQLWTKHGGDRTLASLKDVPFSGL